MTVIAAIGNGEAKASVMTKVQTASNLMFGTTPAISTWGDIRTRLNAAATTFSLPTIDNFESGLSARTKVNAIFASIEINVLSSSSDGEYLLSGVDGSALLGA